MEIYEFDLCSDIAVSVNNWLKKYFTHLCTYKSNVYIHTWVASSSTCPLDIDSGANVTRSSNKDVKVTSSLSMFALSSVMLARILVTRDILGSCVLKETSKL